MKRIGIFLGIACIVLPSSSVAIVVETSAFSHTGGVTVSSSEQAVTNDGHTSSEIRTIIQTGPAGTNVDLYTKAVENDDVRVEAKQYSVPDGAEIRVIESARSTGTIQKSRVLHGRATTTVHATAAAPIVSDATISAQSRLVAWFFQMQRLSALFTRLFAGFGFGAF